MGKPKTSIIWKTSDRRAKLIEIWVSGVSVQCILLTFKWLRSFRVIRCISDFRQLCILKMIGYRVKRSEMWASGLSTECIHVLLAVGCSFWGHLVHFRVLIILYLENECLKSEAVKFGLKGGGWAQYSTVYRVTFVS